MSKSTMVKPMSKMIQGAALCLLGPVLLMLLTASSLPAAGVIGVSAMYVASLLAMRLYGVPRACEVFAWLLAVPPVCAGIAVYAPVVVPAPLVEPVTVLVMLPAFWAFPVVVLAGVFFVVTGLTMIVDVVRRAASVV